MEKMSPEAMSLISVSRMDSRSQGVIVTVCLVSSMRKLVSDMYSKMEEHTSYRYLGSRDYIISLVLRLVLVSA